VSPGPDRRPGASGRQVPTGGRCGLADSREVQPTAFGDTLPGDRAGQTELSVFSLAPQGAASRRSGRGQRELNPSTRQHPQSSSLRARRIPRTPASFRVWRKLQHCTRGAVPGADHAEPCAGCVPYRPGGERAPGRRGRHSALPADRRPHPACVRAECPGEGPGLSLGADPSAAGFPCSLRGAGSTAYRARIRGVKPGGLFLP
jgi:hypothetical protein